jgi:hypothetical protein
MDRSFIIGNISLTTGQIPQVSSSLTKKDRISAMKVRWDIHRNDYSIPPGLYAIGNPAEGSDVFVTANYKLSFDTLRKNLAGIDAWILVLNTHGINVWCAAGKGTFATKELCNRIETTNLTKIVNHRKLILPQLGATGVSAHQVKEVSGFRVKYGPVRADDIKTYISNNYKATPEMRTVRFSFSDRLILIPVEIVYRKYYLLAAIALFIILSGISTTGYSLDNAMNNGLKSALLLLIAYFSGTLITPLLLPWIPFRAFSMKGFVTGAIITVGLFFTNLFEHSLIPVISWTLMIGSVSSFLAMNFTGSSTFTSLSGVKKEMKTALPVQIGFSATGFILFLISKFV